MIDCITNELDELIEATQTDLTVAQSDFNYLAAAVLSARLADQSLIRAIIAGYASDDSD